MESSTFRGVHEAGECAGLCKVLVRLGTKRFGQPSTTLVALLEASEDTGLLHRLIDRLFDANCWEDIAPIDWSPMEVEGVVHGGMVALDDEKVLPKGTRVRLSVATLAASEDDGERIEPDEGVPRGQPQGVAEPLGGHRRGRRKR